MKVIELHENLKEVKSEELVPMVLNGFSSSWNSFVQWFYASEKLSTFEKLWEEFTQKKTRLDSAANIRGAGYFTHRQDEEAVKKEESKREERGFKFL